MHFDAFASVAVIAAVAAVLVWVLQKLGQSAIIAYLLLGLILGPSGLNAAQSTESVQHLSEAGIMFLLFFVGLEFHLDTLKRMLGLALGGTALQVGATALTIGGIGVLFGWPFGASLLAGLCIGLSSTAIVLKAFEDRKEGDSYEAETCVAILIGQDLIALLALAILPFMLGVPKEGTFGLSPTLSLGLMLVALPALFFAVRWLFPKLFTRAAVSRSPEVFALASLAGCLVVAVASRELGASLALGAFLGGLVFADTPFSHQIRADLAVFKNLALGFFFVTVGMLLDLNYLKANILPLLLGLAVVITVKTAVTAGAVRAFRVPASVAVAVGIALSQISEFALVLSALGKGNVLSSDQFQYLSALTVLTMLVAPFLVARARPLGRSLTGLGRSAEPVFDHAQVLKEHGEVGDIAGPKEAKARAVVVGYGPVGRTLCRILIRFGVQPCVIDLAVPTIEKLRNLGREGVFGDASRREVQMAAGVQEAKFLAITLPDFASRASIIATARTLNPTIAIISRARYLTERTPLEGAGANFVAVEETEVACELARHLLRGLNVPEEKMEQEVSRIADEIVSRSGFTRMMTVPIGLGTTTRRQLQPPESR